MNNTTRTTGRRGPFRAVVAMATVSAFALAACGGDDEGAEAGATGEAAAGEEITLRMSWWGADARHETTQEIIEAFEAANPDINVEGEFTGFGDYWDRLATSTAGGNPPDVMQQDTRYIREYADRGALLDLDPYIPEVIETAELDESVLDTGQIDGATYAIPTGINAFSVVADPQAFAEAGLEVPDDTTWTWDDLIGDAAQISEATGPEFYGMQDPGFVETSLEVFARQRGESFFTDDGELGLSDETLTEWFNIILQARDTGAEPPAAVTVETQAGGVDQSLLATNSGALGFWWTNELPTLTGAAGRELELLRFPGEEGQAGMYFKPAMFWAASADGAHPEASAKLIDFLINDPVAAELNLADRGLPINTELRAEIVPQLTDADQQSAEFLEEIGPDLAEPPILPPPGAGEVQGILQRLNEQLLFDQITPEEAAEQFRSQATAATA